MNLETQKKLLELVRANYNDIADQFAETRKKHLEPLWSELINIADLIPGGSRVLDVGCGNGRLLEAFKNKNISYLGIDSSERLVEISKKNHSHKKSSDGNLKFVVGDILDLGKIPEINFDYVFCVAVLHHLPGQDLRVAALKQLKNKVNQQGKIIITVWNLWSQMKFRKLISKYFVLKLIGKNRMDFGDILFDWKDSGGQSVSQRYYHAFYKRELKKIIRKAGLKIERLYRDKFNYYVILTK